MLAGSAFHAVLAVIHVLTMLAIAPGVDLIDVGQSWCCRRIQCNFVGPMKIWSKLSCCSFHCCCYASSAASSSQTLLASSSTSIVRAALLNKLSSLLANKANSRCMLTSQQTMMSSPVDEVKTCSSDWWYSMAKVDLVGLNVVVTLSNLGIMSFPLKKGIVGSPRCCQQNVDIHTQVEFKKASHVVPSVLNHVGLSCWSGMWQRKSMMVVYSMLKYRRSLWYASCCQTLLTPWLKRMYVCAYTPRTMFARCAHVRTLTRRLRWNCCSAAAWLLNNDVCWSQHHRCDAKASLFQRIWWRRLPDCWWCWSWLSSQDRVRPAVVWTSVWVQCASPSLTTQLPCSFRLRNLCGRGCWSSSCWELLSGSCWCVVSASVAPVLIRRVLPPRCSAQLLLVFYCRSGLLLQRLWSGTLSLTSLSLGPILPSRCQRIPECQARCCFCCWCLGCWSHVLLVVLCSFDAPR